MKASEDDSNPERRLNLNIRNPRRLVGVASMVIAASILMLALMPGIIGFVEDLVITRFASPDIVMKVVGNSVEMTIRINTPSSVPEGIAVLDISESRLEGSFETLGVCFSRTPYDYNGALSLKGEGASVSGTARFSIESGVGVMEVVSESVRASFSGSSGVAVETIFTLRADGGFEAYLDYAMGSIEDLLLESSAYLEVEDFRLEVLEQRGDAITARLSFQIPSRVYSGTVPPARIVEASLTQDSTRCSISGSIVIEGDSIEVVKALLKLAAEDSLPREYRGLIKLLAGYMEELEVKTPSQLKVESRGGSTTLYLPQAENPSGSTLSKIAALLQEAGLRSGIKVVVEVYDEEGDLLERRLVSLEELVSGG